MKNLITLIILTLQINFINGQSGYISLEVHDGYYDYSSYSVEIIRLDKQNLEPLIGFQFFETVYELEKGSYSVKINERTGYTTELNSYVRGKEIIDTFDIVKSDTIFLSLIMKPDTIYPIKKEYIKEIDLNGGFYCQYLNCVDENGKRNGLVFGQICNLGFETNSFVEVYIQDKSIIRILTEGNHLTYCYDNSADEVKQFRIVDFAMNNDQMIEFITENFKNGQMKRLLTYNGNLLERIE